MQVMRQVLVCRSGQSIGCGDRHRGCAMGTQSYDEVPTRMQRTRDRNCEVEYEAAVLIARRTTGFEKWNYYIGQNTDGRTSKYSSVMQHQAKVVSQMRRAQLLTGQPQPVVA